MNPLFIKSATEFAANPCFETHRDFCYHMNLMWGMSEAEAKAGANLWAVRCMTRDEVFGPVFDADLEAARIYSEM